MSCTTILPAVVNGDFATQELPLLPTVCQMLDWLSDEPDMEFPPEIHPDLREMFDRVAAIAREAG